MSFKKDWEKYVKNVEKAGGKEIASPEVYHSIKKRLSKKYPKQYKDPGEEKITNARTVKSPKGGSLIGSKEKKFKFTNIKTKVVGNKKAPANIERLKKEAQPSTAKKKETITKGYRTLRTKQVESRLKNAGLTEKEIARLRGKKK
ncbi:MAG: hypothetical protein WC451_03235 [Patescibacteria group bacterium]|jgi:hypothetical protein